LKPDKRAYTSIVPDIIGPVATTTKLKHPPECPGINTNAIWQSSRQRGTPTVVYPFAMEFFHICIYSCTHGQIFPCWGSIIGSAFVSKSAKSKLKLQEEKPSLAWKICDSKLRSYASITWAKIDSNENFRLRFHGYWFLRPPWTKHSFLALPQMQGWKPATQIIPYMQV
jgi:hypothetical protein